ncbi:MAG: hypothetical protein ACYC6Y_26580 [Thermoguttaceae bacterium]
MSGRDGTRLGDRHRPALKAAIAGFVCLVAAACCLMRSPASAAELGPQGLFEAGGIGKEQLDGIANGQPWQASGNETLRRMLYRIEKDVRPGDLERWSSGEAELARLAADPEPHRFDVFRLRGRVLLAEPYRLSSKEGDAGSLASIWRCRMQLDGQAQPIDVFAARVPKGWKIGTPIEEPSGALAFFLKTSKGSDAGPAAFFLADRMAWHPPTFLGRLGMDVGLLDDVVVEPPPRKNADGTTPEIDWSTRQLTDRDRECFYQMLQAVGSSQEGQLEAWARQELEQTGDDRFSVVPLFNRPQTQQGRLVQFRGAARRILTVRVSDRDVNERFGIRQYYQIYLFTEDSQDNPLVFCLRELPKGLPVGDGPDFAEDVSIAGFFFKTWSYPVSAGSPGEKPQRQLAPLLIGKTAVWHPETPAFRLNAAEKWAGTVLLLLVVGACWWTFRRRARGDREFARQMRRRTGPEGGLDFRLPPSSPGPEAGVGKPEDGE